MKLIQTFIFLLISIIANSTISLPSILSNHMVIQRDLPFKIYGYATNEAEVTITFEDQTLTGEVNDGYWEAEFNAHEAGGPFQISIKGENEIILSDIYFGDVFLCSGQSNMEFPTKEIKKAEYELSKSDFPMIRMMTIAKSNAVQPKMDCVLEHKWSVCSEEIAKEFSAIGFLTGRTLFNKHQIPIGLIDNSWGGSTVDTWMNKSTLRDSPKYLETVELMESAYEKGKVDLTLDFPTGKFNGMMAPLFNIKIAAILWYQGESDVNDAANYGWKFIRMIEDLRDRFSQPKLPFIFVQLPSYKSVNEKPTSDSWATIRSQQSKALLLENTAMVNTIDLGDPDDIHPKDKKSIADRMIYPIDCFLHNKCVDYHPPSPSMIEKTDEGYLITFDHTDNTLMALYEEKIQGFAVPDPSGEMVFATGEIIAPNQVLVKTPHPMTGMVRFLWSSNPGKIQLYNSLGNPAAPFQYFVE